MRRKGSLSPGNVAGRTENAGPQARNRTRPIADLDQTEVGASRPDTDSGHVRQSTEEVWRSSRARAAAFANASGCFAAATSAARASALVDHGGCAARNRAAMRGVVTAYPTRKPHDGQYPHRRRHRRGELLRHHVRAGARFICPRRLSRSGSRIRPTRAPQVVRRWSATSKDCQ
jgi:hypothetical protein